MDFDLKELVALPREIDLNEWLASNSKCVGVGRILFYKRIADKTTALMIYYKQIKSLEMHSNTYCHLI